MLRPLQKLWYRVLVRFFWKKIPGLLKFQATEAESAWQLQRVIGQIQSPLIQRDVFEHYLEEMAHAEIFAAKARQEALAAGKKAMPRLPIAERQPILAPHDEVWRFFAFLSVGEASAVRQFSRITHALPESSLKKTLRAILRDESRHVADALAHARELAEPEALAREFKRLKRQRFKAEWMRQGLKITDALSSALLWTVYWIVAPLGRGAARRKIYGTVPSKVSTSSLTANQAVTA